MPVSSRTGSGAESKPQMRPETSAPERQIGPDPVRSNRQGGVVAILPRGEALRNFVYTGALDEVAREMDLSILTVVPNEEFVTFLEARYPRVMPLIEAPEKWPVRYLRELLDVAHGRWIWSVAAQERWRLRDLEATTLPQKVSRLGKKMLCAPFANRAGLEWLSRLERSASRRLKTTDHYIDLFKQQRPSLVFNASHIHSQIAIQAVQAAQWLGIRTATFLFSWDNLTSQGRMITPYDYYLVWNEAIRRQLLEMYGSIRPEQVVVCGTPQFDFHFRPEFYWSREEFCAHVGADPARPIVLYSTGMANHVIGEPVVVEALADILRGMGDLGPPQLLVRLYAKGPTGHFDDLRERRPDILFPDVPWERAWLTPKPEDCYLLTNMLRHCAAGVNVASTISLELCMFDKPVINVGYRGQGVGGAFDYRRYYEFEHYKPVVASGAVSLARSEAELADLVRQALMDPARDADKRRSLLRTFFADTLDGRAGTRVAQHLLKFAGARA